MATSKKSVQLLLLLIALQSAAVTSSLFGDESTLLRGGVNKANGEEKTKPSWSSRLLEAFTRPGGPGTGSAPEIDNGGTRMNTLAPEAKLPMEPFEEVVRQESGEPNRAATLRADDITPNANTAAPTLKPTVVARDQHAEIGVGDVAPMLNQVLPLLRGGAEQLEPLFGANGTYLLEDFMRALEWSYEWETSISEKKSMGIIDRRSLQLDDRKVMDLSGERIGEEQGSLKVAMAHIALLLGTAWHSGFHTGMCDEPNHNATDDNHPGCGQDDLNYRYPFDGFAEEGFGCFKNDQEWLTGTPTGCPVQPNMDWIISDAKEEDRKLVCGLQTDIGSRDCCWWGRGMLQMTHQCDYGDYQAHWGSAANAPPDRPAVDLCGNPGQVCSDEFPELRFLTGLYTWVRDVVHAEDPTFSFIPELKEWVNGKMDMRQDGNFVDRVGGVLLYGDPNLLPPDYRERRHTVEAALDSIMSLAPIMETPTYGNIARCKPATMSSIMEGEVGANALDGIINQSNISHTMCEENPWFQVDLDGPHEIYAVAVVNRQDGYFDRMDHVMIELLDEEGNLIEHNHTAQHDPNMEGHVVNVFTVDYAVPPIASKVRISLRAPPGYCEYLHMAEVQVFGYCGFGDACLTGRACNLENVAQCKPTSQSSTASAALPAAVAVDGDVAPSEEILVAGTDIAVSSTECEQDPFWQVDLMTRHNISMVAVFIPGDSSTMNGLLVELIDGETGATVTSKQHDPGTGPIGNIAIFEMENDTEEHLASIVRLRLPAGEGEACATLELAEVQVFSDCWAGAACMTWPSCSYENVAQCKAATQSSTSDGGVAWKAIDGHQDLSHTQCEEAPWWEVDLLEDSVVNEVILYNRHDGWFDRLNGVVIELQDRNGNLIQSVQHEPAVDGVIEDSWSVKFMDSPVARKVRVMIQHEPDTCGFLNIQDIQVMRTCAGGEDCHSWSGCESGNIAQCKPTTQSSTFYGDVSAQAVDGDESLAHTDCELNPWWGVNLLEPRVVTHVVVHNREDCCFERLSGLLVTLYDEQDNILQEIQHDPIMDGLINTMWIASFEQSVPNVRKVFLSTIHPEGFCEFLNLAEVEVMSECLDGDSCMTGFGCDAGNVAQCKPARQSSTMASRVNNTITAGVAGKAVDGKESLSHTDCEAAPWWEVNLLSMRSISEVILHNRQDAFFERLNGVLVELIDDAGDVVASAQHDPGTDGMIQFSWLSKFDEVGASRVKISTRFEGQCDYLNLADVEVISTCIEGDACLTMDDCIYGNVAQCKPARQISTMGGSIANNAINGIDSLSHTDCEENPWWEVDLLGVYHVSEVIIFNRVDCCAERLSGVMVELLDHNGTTLKLIQHDASQEGIIEDKWIAYFDQFDFYMASTVRISTLHAPGTCGFLNMADVQVMGICQEGDACYTGSTCAHGDVAQCKKAEQSSTRNGAAAIKATNGENGDIAMTTCEQEPWWMVDLETRRDVSEVVVYNRLDCCSEQLNGVTVSLLDSFGTVLATTQHDLDTEGVIDSVWSTKFHEENVR